MYLTFEYFDSVMFVLKNDAFEELLDFRRNFLTSFICHFQHFSHATGALINQVGAKLIEIFSEGIHVLRERIELDFYGIIVRAHYSK